MNIRTIHTLRRLRRISQGCFLILFIFAAFLARYSRTIDLPPHELAEGTPLMLFFQFDPLLALGLLLSSRTIVAGFVLSLVTICATVVLGRFFCGWVCPFGTLHHLFSQMKFGWEKSMAERVRRGQYQSWQALKYYILLFVLITTLFGLLQPGLLDPLCLLARSLIISVFPAFHSVAKGVLLIGEKAGFTSVARLHDLLEARDLIGGIIAYRSSLLTALVLLVLLGANVFYTRFWCRCLCPLGALLGIASRFSLLRMQKIPERCTMAGTCAALCQGGSSPEGRAIGRPGGRVNWRAPECLVCLNCVTACPEDVLGFEFLGLRDSSDYRPDLTRRGLITSIGAGFLALPLLRCSRSIVQRAGLLRPPGALPEAEFLSRCLRCGTCTRICPTHAIHSAITEAGLEGFWTPRLIPRIGYCVYRCTLCGQVCPSQAITRLSLEEKIGSERMRPIKIGTAVVDRRRCISWSKGMQCLACEEVCPVSPKAIRIDVETKSRLGRPVVDALACVGCGHCEYVCPVDGAAAITVGNTLGS